MNAIHNARASLNLNLSNSTLDLRTKLPNGDVRERMIMSGEGGGMSSSASFLASSAVLASRFVLFEKNS